MNTTTLKIHSRALNDKYYGKLNLWGTITLKSSTEIYGQFEKQCRYDKRRKNYPAFPKSLNESIEQLKAMENDDIIQFQ
ncbi:MULE domain-containing protein, partial [Aphis craccivora]